MQSIPQSSRNFKRISSFVQGRAFTFWQVDISAKIRAGDENGNQNAARKRKRGKRSATAMGNLWHKLEDILIIGLSSVVCQGEDYEDMELSGTEQKEWLEGFLNLPNGIPDSDT